MTVEVVFAAASGPEYERLRVPSGSTLADALELSALAQRVQQTYAPSTLQVGIFGQLCSSQEVLAEGDRIELYRPLQIDPKDARRRRAAVRQRQGR